MDQVVVDTERGDLRKPGQVRGDYRELVSRYNEVLHPVEIIDLLGNYPGKVIGVQIDRLDVAVRNGDPIPGAHLCRRCRRRPAACRGPVGFSSPRCTAGAFPQRFQCIELVLVGNDVGLSE